MIKMKQELQIQKKEVKKQRENYSHAIDKQELFDNLEAPLLSGDERMNAMNNKLIDANLQGKEAEIYGRNVQNELYRNQHQFEVVNENVKCFFIN